MYSIVETDKGPAESENKLKELYKLTNRINKYRKKLLKESLKIIEEKRLESIATDEIELELYNNQEYQVVIAEEMVSFYSLSHFLKYKKFLKFCRMEFPSLYRKYNKSVDSRKKLSEELNRMDGRQERCKGLTKRVSFIN